MKRTLASGVMLVLAVALVLAWTPAVWAEEGEEPSGAEITEVPTAEATQEPTPEPAVSEPVTLVPATPIPATAVPATPEPTPTPTMPPATEAPGTVNLHMFIYTSADTPAAGYTVQMDNASVTTDASGQADFPNLTVSQHGVQITSPDGSQSVGRLYMSRSGSTRLTDQAMGGTYGVDVERGIGELYMLITFVPGEAMTIRTLSNSPPALPEPEPAQPTPSLNLEQSVKALTATFLDEEGQPLADLAVQVTAYDGTTLENSTDARGQITIPQVPYGRYTVAVAADGADTARFDLTLQAAATTGIAQNAGTNFVVNSSTTAKHLYLEFRRAGSLFTLTEASDAPIGGISSMMLGIIVVSAVVVILVVVLVLRHRKKKKTVAGPPPRRTNYNPTASSDDDDSLREDLPRRTGGANKFDDRSRM